MKRYGTYNEKFHKRILELSDEVRFKRGIFYREQSTEMGVASSTLSYWRAKGEMPLAHNLIKIARYYGVSVEYLAGKTDERRPKAGSAKGESPKAEAPLQLDPKRYLKLPLDKDGKPICPGDEVTVTIGGQRFRKTVGAVSEQFVCFTDAPRFASTFCRRMPKFETTNAAVKHYADLLEKDPANRDKYIAELIEQVQLRGGRDD